MTIRELRWTLIHSKRKFRDDLKSWSKYLRSWRGFWRTYRQYQQIASEHTSLEMEYLYPCFGDDTPETPIEPIYFYQDAWAFEKIVARRPRLHVDVGSHYKFVSLLSKVLPVIMVDIRPLALPLNSLDFREGSILSLPFEDGSITSISSLCVVEHIGLGRYGDSLDPYGTEKAIEEFKRAAGPGGEIYVSLPLDDKNRTYFNAHRAFREKYVVELFEPFQIVESRYIYGNEFCNQPKSGFGTGCYHLKRP